MLYTDIYIQYMYTDILIVSYCIGKEAYNNVYIIYGLYECMSILYIYMLYVVKR